MSLLGATILTAIATVVLAVGAIITSVFAYLAFRKQSREISDQAEMLDLQRRQLAEQEKTNTEHVKVLTLQAEELRKSLRERERDADERRRAQASRVFLAVSRDEAQPITPYVHNASDLPIYETKIQAAAGSGNAKEPENLEIILPGEAIPATRLVAAGEAVRFTILTFRDAAGLFWQRYPNGLLEELSAAPTFDTDHGA
jgi:hypothetical protein